MAVYTHISEDDLKQLLSRYDIGALERFEGIEKGVSNTNYHVFTTQGRFVLTLFEEHRVQSKDLPFFFAYADHLNAHGVRCPSAIKDKKGAVVQRIQNKAAALIEFLDGCDIPRGQTNDYHCAQMGSFLGRTHLAVQDFAQSRLNEWAPVTFKARFNLLRSQISKTFPKATDLIEKTLFDVTALEGSLAGGVCHLDLFPDNVFFKDDEITAMIDMYFAANAPFIYDLAITVNAWCFDRDNYFDVQKFQALLRGYEEIKSLSVSGKAVFQPALRVAALRILLSRLEEWFAYDPDRVTMKPHNPEEYIHILSFHFHNDVSAFLR